jgi:hypothetical protein
VSARRSKVRRLRPEVATAEPVAVRDKGRPVGADISLGECATIAEESVRSLNQVAAVLELLARPGVNGGLDEALELLCTKVCEVARASSSRSATRCMPRRGARHHDRAPAVAGR